MHLHQDHLRHLECSFQIHADPILRSCILLGQKKMADSGRDASTWSSMQEYCPYSIWVSTDIIIQKMSVANIQETIVTNIN